MIMVVVGVLGENPLKILGEVVGLDSLTKEPIVLLLRWGLYSLPVSVLACRWMLQKWAPLAHLREVGKEP